MRRAADVNPVETQPRNCDGNARNRSRPDVRRTQGGQSAPHDDQRKETGGIQRVRCRRRQGQRHDAEREKRRRRGEEKRDTYYDIDLEMPEGIAASSFAARSFAAREAEDASLPSGASAASTCLAPEANWTDIACAASGAWAWVAFGWCAKSGKVEGWEAWIATR